MPSLDIIGVRLMVFSATLSNISVISWQSVLLVEGNTGARCVGKKKNNKKILYNTTRGGTHLLPFF